MPKKADIPQLPPFVTDFKAKYREGTSHAFLLTGNVHDFPRGNTPFFTFLAQQLANRNCIVFFDRAGGFQFPTIGATSAEADLQQKEMRDRFIAASGLGGGVNTKQAAALAASGMTKALSVELPREPVAAVGLIDTVLRTAPKLIQATDAATGEVRMTVDPSSLRAAIIIRQAEKLAPAADIAAMGPEDRTILACFEDWAKDQQIAINGHMLFLVTGNRLDLHPNLTTASSGYYGIDIPKPDLEDRRAHCGQIVANVKGLKTEVTVDQFAMETGGLRRKDIEDIVLQSVQRSKATDTPIPVSRGLIQARKREIFAQEYQDVLQLVYPDPTWGFDEIGGHQLAKKFVQRNVIDAISSGNLKRVPMGILLLGPSGTGKSKFFQALVTATGYQGVELSIPDLKDKWVGNTEKNLRKALSGADALNPCLVFVDEIDKILTDQEGGQGNQLDTTILNVLLRWAADTTKRGQRILIAAANRPENVPAEAFRMGRFDMVIPFLTPEDEERADLLRIFTRLQGFPVDVQATDLIVQRTNGWTGAELEGLCVKALGALEDGDAPTGPEALDMARSWMRPNTRDIWPMTLRALSMCGDLRLVPEKYHVLFQEQETIQNALASESATAAVFQQLGRADAQDGREA